MIFIAGTPVHCEVISLRPASRDLSGDARSGNIHQHAVRDDRKHQNPRSLKSPEVPMVQTTNNKHALSNKLPSYLQSLHQIRSARSSLVSMRLGSDIKNSLSTIFNTWKLPDISSLHNVIRTGIRLERTDANFIFSKRIFRLPPNRSRGPRRLFGGPCGAKRQNRDSVSTEFGGAERDRTADPLLAKQVLSQLSYSPNSLVPSAAAKPRQHQDKTWWARVDSNYRPHAYQACALTD
jgi:hypothetical protein